MAWALPARASSARPWRRALFLHGPPVVHRARLHVPGHDGPRSCVPGGQRRRRWRGWRQQWYFQPPFCKPTVATPLPPCARRQRDDGRPHLPQPTAGPGCSCSCVQSPGPGTPGHHSSRSQPTGRGPRAVSKHGTQQLSSSQCVGGGNGQPALWAARPPSPRVLRDPTVHRQRRVLLSRGCGGAGG